MLVRSQIDPEEVGEILQAVDAQYHSHPYYVRLTQKAEGARRTKVGAKAPNITSTQTLDGQVFDMSTIKDKYILIDFWGTWCGPCMSGMPHMKEYKEKYGDKLEIIAIAKDSKANWEKAAKDGSMPWVHILNGKGMEDFISAYNVQGYPTKLLLRPNTYEIVYRASGENPELYEKMDELFL